MLKAITMVVVAIITTSILT